MLLVNKIGCSGIVLVLLTTGMSAPRLTLPTPDLAKEAPGFSNPNDVNKTQQTLLDQGRYRGKVDGVFGLRTRAGIREFQKAENLRVTGQLDIQTAGKLGVAPEAPQSTQYESRKDKPSAGIQSVKGQRRTSRARQKTVKSSVPGIPPA